MKKKTEINNVINLIDDLKLVYTEMRNGDLPLSAGKDIANVAGKLLKASSVKLEYNKFLENHESIKFLEK